MAKLWWSVTDGGATGDGVMDDRTAIQNVLNAAAAAVSGDRIATVYFEEAKIFLLDPPSSADQNRPGNGLLVPSNVRLLGPGATLLLGRRSGAQSYRNVLMIRDGRNVIGEGLRIDGNRDGQTDVTTSAGQDGGMHGIVVYGGERVRIAGCSVVNCWTDGVYVDRNQGDASATAMTADLTVTDTVHDNNGRQGMSIVTARGPCYFTRNRYQNTDGRNPQAGVDLETDSTTEGFADLHFEYCQFLDNGGYGWMADCRGLLQNVTLRGCKFSGNARAENIALSMALRGQSGGTPRVRKLTIEDCTLDGRISMNPNGDRSLGRLDLAIIRGNKMVGANAGVRIFRFETPGNTVIVRENYIASSATHVSFDRSAGMSGTFVDQENVKVPFG